MKRIIITITMSLMLFFTAAAENNHIQNTEAYNIKVNTTALARTLEINEDQTESIENVMSLFMSQMKNISVEGNTHVRNKMLKNTIDMNIHYMRHILNKDQYKKYLAILNATLNNRNLYPENVE